MRIARGAARAVGAGRRRRGRRGRVGAGRPDPGRDPPAGHRDRPRLGSAGRAPAPVGARRRRPAVAPGRRRVAGGDRQRRRRVGPRSARRRRARAAGADQARGRRPQPGRAVRDRPGVRLRRGGAGRHQGRVHDGRRALAVRRRSPLGPLQPRARRAHGRAGLALGRGHAPVGRAVRLGDRDRAQPRREPGRRQLHLLPRLARRRPSDRRLHGDGRGRSGPAAGRARSGGAAGVRAAAGRRLRGGGGGVGPAAGQGPTSSPASQRSINQSSAAPAAVTSGDTK